MNVSSRPLKTLACQIRPRSFKGCGLSDITRLRRAVSLRQLSRCLLDAGSSQAQFDLDDHRTKDEIIRAILALPMISTQGNDVSGAMETLRQDVLSFGWRGYDNYIQKVALTFTDQSVRDRRQLTTAYQVPDTTLDYSSQATPVFVKPRNRLLDDTSIHVKLPRLSVCVCLSLSSGFLKNVRTDFHETFHGS